MTIATLADVRKLMRHLPKDRREMSTWRVVAGDLEAAARGADVAGVGIALRLVHAGTRRVPPAVFHAGASAFQISVLVSRFVSLLIEGRDIGTPFFYVVLLQNYLPNYACTGMETAPAKLAERYWDYAAQCLVIAQRQDNSCDKQALTDIAQALIALAEKAQREALDHKRTESVY